MDSFVSAEQAGRVPKRQIKEHSLLCKLIQAYLEEKYETGLFLFLDSEKAFDRVSHDYLLKAGKGLGVGPDMMAWLQLLYSPCDPMQRRVQVNGHY
eukprot:201312-Prymnesium_polylepis.1